MTDTDVLDEAPPPPAPPAPEQQYTGDPLPPAASPLILNDCYFEMSGVNLRCLVKHLEAAFAENKPVTVTSFCGEVDYPGVTKWHLRATFYQSFDSGAVYATLQQAYAAYVANGAPVQWRARPYSSRAPAANNPWVSGYAIPQPFDLIVGDAGSTAEVQIDWNLTAPPTVDLGTVAATTANAGQPGYYSPSGAQAPANLAALSGVTAAPATAWTTGQYIITGDMLANHWTGSAWAAGKA